MPSVDTSFAATDSMLTATRPAGRSSPASSAVPAPLSEPALRIATTLLAVVCFALHYASDVALGFEKGQMSNLPAFPIMVLWLYGALVLAERRAGLIISLLGSIFASAIPVIHMSGRGMGVDSGIPARDGAHFFIATLVVLGTSALFSAVLATRALWSSRARSRAD